MTTFQKIDAALKVIFAAALIAALGSPLVMGMMAIAKLQAVGF